MNDHARAPRSRTRRACERALPLLALALLLATLAAAAVPALARNGGAPTKLLRFPDIHGDQLVFSYGGDLWRASVEGGTAIRLTAHPGVELFAKFSPDGRSIAFTGQYDGDEQVYVMPSEGGEPRQLTYYPAAGPLPPRWGYDHQVYGWTPDGERILFRSLRDADGISVNSNLYSIDADGGLPVRLPMPDSGAGDLSSDGKKIFYSPLMRDFRTWKRYEGGWAQDLYVFDLASHEVTPIAHHKRTERDPMWLEDGLYFVSDRDDTLNLYRANPDGTGLEQLTDSSEWDVRWASSDGRSRIVYEFAGELAIYDTKTGEVARPSIHVPDDGLHRRPRHLEVGDQITDWELSPGGERALFIARGDVFTAPIEEGPTRNLTNTSTAAEKHSRWSPDGRTIAFVSDESGEEQLYVIPQAGGEAKRVSSFGDASSGDDTGMLFAPVWSPDSEQLAVTDKNGKVYVVDVETGAHVEIADDEHGLINDQAWSPDSRWLSFSMSEDNGNSSIWIWGRDDGSLHRVTGEMFDEAGATWDPAGKYLFYLSQREFTPQISQVEWNFAGNRMTAVFALALTKSTPHPLPPESDEVKVSDEADAAGASESEPETVASDDDGAAASEGAGDAEGEDDVEIDFDGLAERVVRLPIDADNLGGLTAVEGKLVYSTFGEPYYGRASSTQPALHLFDFESRESKEILSGFAGYALSADGKKAIVNRGGSFAVHDVKPASSDGESVSTADLELDSVPAEEWKTIFDQVWRRYRDFFYVDNLHGYDWDGIGEQYQTLLEHVAHRSDLNYVIGEMIAELNVGHAYIAGGDVEIPDRPAVALPGARFELDSTSGRYRIADILEGHNAEPRYRSPLTEVGVDVAEGDWVLAVDGAALEGADNPYRLLRYKTDPVTLTVASSPDGETREVSFRPIPSESSLIYLDRVSRNRAWVDENSDGRVGYLHIPDMGANGAYEFIKWYYPQIRKEGLVVDVRSNGGGNISQWIIERLDTELLGTRFSFSDDSASTYPGAVFHGHMVCLINGTSASDGDIFPARFRKAGLGPLIGKRTWGGVVGISGFGPLLDGGSVSVPLASTNDVDGSYIIEGEGVAPDIEVDNVPADVIAGRDAQLERGLEEVLAAMEREPKRLPERPADPVKTKSR